MINLDTKIDLVVKIDNDGPFDDTEPSYDVVVPDIWAKKTRLLGREYLKIGLEHNVIPVHFVIRNRKDIIEDMYVKHDNVIYNIVGFETLKDDTDYMLIATVKKQVLT